jgi:membrane fusion protein (multidrug efflux system)
VSAFRAFLLAACLTGSACGADAATATQSAALPEARSPVMAAIRPEPVAASIPALGRDAFSNISVQVVARRSSQISAPLGGRLVVFPLEDGDRFAAGDILARFHCDQQEAQLGRARSELQKRRGILDTNQKLRQLGTWSQSDFQIATAEVSSANADVSLAQANVEACVVRAPFAGRVAGVSTHNFQFLVAGAPLLDILDDRDLQLELVVPSNWLAWMVPGDPFRIHVAETGLDYEAAITRTSGRVDAVSRTLKVYGAIGGKMDRLLPGMSGTAVFPQR